MHESLKSYARTYLRRARPDLDFRSMEAYVTCTEFGQLVGKFDKGLLSTFELFLAKVPSTSVATPARGNIAGPGTAPAPVPPAAPPAAHIPPKMPFRELSDPARPAPSIPAASPAPVPATAEPVDAAPVESVTQSEVGSSAPAAAAVPLATAEPAGAPAPDPAAAPARPGVVPPAPAMQDALPSPDMPDIAFRLPNARVGSAYQQRLEALGSKEAVVFADLTVPAGLSMTADPQAGTLAGLPVVEGEYTITVHYHFASQSRSRLRRALVTILVAPDPRTMWKNLPSERSDPYWKEDEQQSSLHGPDLSIVAASKRGRSHAHVGSFRDDDYRIAHLADAGWYMAVLADGAGSARCSRRGAQIICEQAKKHILSSLTDGASAQIDAGAQAYVEAQKRGQTPEQVEAVYKELHSKLSRIVGNAAYWAVKAIHDEVQERKDINGVFKDYSSTALITVCKRYPFGTLCAAYWVGDGAIGIYSRRDGIILLGDVDSGEFSGQTRFLDNTAVDHEVLLKRTRFAIVPEMTALVLMTDGVSDAKFETEARLARADDWHAFWTELDREVGFADQTPEQERRLLDWLDFWSQGNHDDRTIAIIY